MQNKRLFITMIAAFLMISSSLAIVIDYNNSDNVSGDSVDYSDWIKISTPEQLSQIGEGDYPLDGKYVLTDNINFTGKDLNGGFDFVIMVDYRDNQIELDLRLFHPFKKGETPRPLSTSNTMIFVNGTAGTLNGNAITFNIVPSENMKVVVNGVCDNVPSNPGTKMNFAVATEISLDDNDHAEYIAHSNGNMDPLCSTTPFTGKFHGNGHKIIGLETAVFVSSGSAYSALFGRVNGATFDGIGLIGGSSVAASSSRSCAGGFIGNNFPAIGSDTTIITNCYNTGDVTATSDITSSAGGLVGYIDSDLTITMTDCYNTGSISATKTSSSYVGGLVGCAGNGPTITMTDCYNTGNMSALSTGGLISYTGSGSTITMTDCYNTGNMSALSAGGLLDTIAGGISSTITVTNCYNTGNVSSSSTAGGLISSIGSSSSSTITATNCYNTGNVSSSTASESSVGGLVGFSHNIMMTNCYNTGNISSSTTSLSYNSSAGGLLGRGYSTLTNCYNTGDVTSTATTTSYAGGLVGFDGTLEMTNCYNRGDVTSTATTTSSYAGGLAGIAADGTITNCYNIGTVSGSTTLSGGIAGLSDLIQIFNCYFLDDGTELKLIGSSTNTKIDDNTVTANPSGSLSKMALQNKTSYNDGTIGTVKGWDFANIWHMVGNGNSNDGFPLLRSLVISVQPKDVVSANVANNVFSIRLSFDSGFADLQWQKKVNNDWNNIQGETNTTFTTNAQNEFGDEFRCKIKLQDGTIFLSGSAFLLKASIDDPGTDDPGTDGPGDEDGNGNGGDDGDDNMMLYIGIAAVAAVAVIGVVYFMFIRKP